MVEVKSKQSILKSRGKSVCKENLYSKQECTCSVCGKKFIAAPEHIYCNRKPKEAIKQCSYSCWCKAGNDTGYI